MPNQNDVKQLANAITKKLADQGKIIEGGWQGLVITSIPPDAPEIQKHEMRLAFFAGAQHLWGSIMSLLESGSEPTLNDLRRMDLINKELEQFIEEFKLEKGFK